MTTETYVGVAACGCPIPTWAAVDPDNLVGWHWPENHPQPVAPALGLPRRPPTVEECELVVRDVSYADAVSADDDPFAEAELGDCVVETPSDPEGQRLLAAALEAFGCCDAAHVIPAGVYLEE